MPQEIEALLDAARQRRKAGKPKGARTEGEK